MNLPRSIGGWLLLLSPAVLLVLALALPTFVRSIGWGRIGAGAYGFEYALFALLLSPVISLCLGVWIARADKGLPVRGLYGLGLGAVILLVNLGVAFAGCASLGQMGPLL